MPVKVKGAVTTKTAVTTAFKKKASGLGALWKVAKEKAPTGSSFITERMEGDFRLVNAEIAKIGERNWLHAAFQFVCISDGEYSGMTHIHRCGIDNEDSLSYLIADLGRLGVDTDALEISSQEDLEEVLKALVAEGPCVHAKLKESDREGFCNMRIGRLIESEEGEEAKEEEGEEDASVDLDSMDRVELKKFIKAHSLDIEVFKKQTDDEIRSKIYEAMTADDEGEGEGDEEPVQIVKGSRVAFEVKGKEQMGTVLSIQEKAGTVKVKTKAGKVLVLKADEVEVLEGEDD